MTSRRSLVAVFVLAALIGCGDSASTPTDAVSADRCVVRLHGKGGEGTAPILTDDGIAFLSPDGNGTAWGGRQWEYDSTAGIDAAREIIAGEADRASCRQIVVHGFSNGGSMAAALICSGERFGDRLIGAIVDDPVTDAVTDGCERAGLPVVLYWTGALDETAPPGTQCADVDWTCDGDLIRGIDAYAADLGVSTTASPFDDHRWFLDSPLPVKWLE